METFEDTLEANVRKILIWTILRKFGVKLSLNFENNLRKRGFGIVEEICMYCEILKELSKKMSRYETLRKFLRKFFLYFGNNLRKYVIENFGEF